ncbi:MAG: helix-turn-helix transcriptional regulator [Candidatus Omnitrophica bacterium]|nr:helix-turn-helix transcriptional regulator [Candidatus Omnitrophota bacterium]
MDKGLRIKELARLIGVTPDSVINWEKRGVKPRWKYLKRLGKILSISIELI